MQNNKRILFFIGNLRSGGKERRLVELLSYLKKHTDYEILVVLRKNQIDYPSYHKLNIPLKILSETFKNMDVSLPFKFLKICREFKPDIIHTWGNGPAAYSLLSIFFLNIIHINSQITSAPPKIRKLSLFNIINRINFIFSNKILSNSIAGLLAYKPPKSKSLVIYNGINLDRFKNLPDQKIICEKYRIRTPYAVIMVASFTENKDYSRYISIAKTVLAKRKDISFVCVGDGPNFKTISEKTKGSDKIIFTGRINDVEALVNACDIGMLLTNENVHGEGISNAITEYFALGLPVIANNAGGTNEIVSDNINGYLIKQDSAEEIANLVSELIDNPIKRNKMGLNGRKLIEGSFTLDQMGEQFLSLYDELNKKTAK